MSANQDIMLNTGAFKENCGTDKNELSESDNAEGQKSMTSKSKMGRWTPEEKAKFIEGKYLSSVFAALHLLSEYQFLDGYSYKIDYI